MILQRESKIISTVLDCVVPLQAEDNISKFIGELEANATVLQICKFYIGVITGVKRIFHTIERMKSSNVETEIIPPDAGSSYCLYSAIFIYDQTGI